MGTTAHILAGDHRALLAAFATSNVLLAFDFDGTLAPIVPNPRLAAMRSRTRRLLSILVRLYPCVVISGRRRDDLAERLDGVPVLLLAANHGMEPWGARTAYASRVSEWILQLSRILGRQTGIVIEDKRYSVALHYRQAPSKPRARHAIARAVRKLRGARAMGGEQAVNIVPRGAPHKGTALELARLVFACDAAIYVGDDDTDEDVFNDAASERLLAIRIGRRPSSRARFYLSSQRDIDAFLKTLIALRSTSPCIPPSRRHRPSK